MARRQTKRHEEVPTVVIQPAVAAAEVQVSSQHRSYYDFLDNVRKHPAIMLGGLNEDWIHGTRMPRLQELLTIMPALQLDQGNPPFDYFNHWLSCRVEGCPKTTLAIHWLEEREKGADSAFDIFFEMLDEYRKCRIHSLQQTMGPYKPSFRLGDGRAPDHPDTIVLQQLHPSSVFFWSEVHGSKTSWGLPFFSTLNSTLKTASERWGVDKKSWFDC